MPNSLTAYDPTIWSKRGIAYLRGKINMPKNVRLDFNTDIAQMGDVVNTRKPASMTASDVDDDNGITAQTVSATNVAVTLNNHKHATWKIKDREASRSVVNLMNEYMDPAMDAVSTTLDKSLLALYTDASSLISVTSAGNWRDQITKARTQLNKNKAPEDGRVLLISDDDEGAVLNLDIFSKANEAGGTQGLREGVIGRARGFDVIRCSNILGAGSPTTRHNLAMHKNACALVTRVLGTATGRTPGAEQQVAMDDNAGLSLRVTISYQHTYLSTMMTVDLLYGVKTLDANLLVQLKSTF